MPDITYISWNIQDFGSRAKYRGINSGITSMIAAMGHAQQADIIFLMELKSSGVNLLNAIRQALEELTSAHWQYDYVKASIRTGLHDDYIYDSSQLAFSAMGHSEGYALFWRESDKFRMLPPAPVYRPAPAGGPVANTMSEGVRPGGADIPKHALGLVMEGLDYEEVPNGQRWQWRPVGGYPNGGGAAPNWVPLDFPPSNINLYPRGEPNLHHPDRYPAFRSRYNGQWRNRYRRPAYCYVKLSNNTVVPIICYHAPSNSTTVDAPASGIGLASFSRQLYQYYEAGNWHNADAAIISGDFNVDSNVNQVAGSPATAYNYFTNGGTNGAHLAPAIPTFPVAPNPPNPAHNTIITLRTGFDGPFRTAPGGGDFPSTNDYLTSEFDNIYYRGLSFPPANNPEWTRIDLLNLYTNVDYRDAFVSFRRDFQPEYRRRIEGFPGMWSTMNYQGMTPFYFDRPLRVKPKFPNIRNFNQFYNTNFDAARRHLLSTANRATFINEFVSDHLPVQLTFHF